MSGILTLKLIYQARFEQLENMQMLFMMFIKDKARRGLVQRYTRNIKMSDPLETVNICYQQENLRIHILMCIVYMCIL